jgi:predicted DNA-binding transcriptional regulator AlpA
MAAMSSQPPTPTPTTGAPRLALRPKEAAAAIGISARKLWEITADKTSGIPHVRLGKAVVYPVRELTGWLADRAKGGGR